ncbi:MAG: hypothetical protein Q7V63_00100 [Gammaproteobacteria bacterium]|nr:hypothetical protein [Gammaproteobacteria bacterium]
MPQIDHQFQVISNNTAAYTTFIKDALSPLKDNDYFLTTGFSTKTVSYLANDAEIKALMMFHGKETVKNIPSAIRAEANNIILLIDFSDENAFIIIAQCSALFSNESNMFFIVPVIGDITATPMSFEDISSKLPASCKNFKVCPTIPSSPPGRTMPYISALVESYKAASLADIPPVIIRPDLIIQHRFLLLPIGNIAYNAFHTSLIGPRIKDDTSFRKRQNIDIHATYAINKGIKVETTLHVYNFIGADGAINLAVLPERYDAIIIVSEIDRAEAPKIAGLLFECLSSYNNVFVIPVELPPSSITSPVSAFARSLCYVKDSTTWLPEGLIKLSELKAGSTPETNRDLLAGISSRIFANNKCKTSEMEDAELRIESSVTMPFLDHPLRSENLISAGAGLSPFKT